MKNWLERIRKHLVHVTKQLDEVIGKWPSICGTDDQLAPPDLYRRYIWKIERELLKFPDLGEERDND
jgi:hypothetical protein